MKKIFDLIKLKSRIKSLIKISNQMNAILNFGINKEKIQYEIETFKDLGITNEIKKSPKLIVSLTSFKGRIYDVHFAIYSLLRQTKKPDMVVLYLVREEFLRGEDELPKNLLKLKENGLTIKWFDKNIKSYTKLIPALEEFPDDIIVTADDDIYYPENWLQKLYETYLENPENIISNRAHKVLFDKKGIKPYKTWKSCIQDGSCEFANFLTGVGGVLYPPKVLYKDVLNQDLFLNLAPNADDVWFWAMSVLNGIKIKILDNPLMLPRQLKFVNPQREIGLYNEFKLTDYNLAKEQNDIQLKNILKHYPEILKLLQKEK